MAKGVITVMRRTSPFLIDVSELLRRPGSSKELRFAAPIGDAGVPLATVAADADVAFDLRLESLVEGIRVRGTARPPVRVECARCLKVLDADPSVEIDDLFVIGASRDDDDVFAIEDDTIDLEPAIRDAVMLALPVNPLCREDCRGLCTTCGADRNDVDCGHSEQRVDVRWEALARLRERMEG